MVPLGGLLQQLDSFEKRSANVPAGSLLWRGPDMETGDCFQRIAKDGAEKGIASSRFVMRRMLDLAELNDRGINFFNA